MGFLERFDMVFKCTVCRFRHAGVPELALVLKRLVFGPEPEYDVYLFSGHLPVLTVHTIYIEHCVIGGQPTGSDSEHEPSLRHVV